MDTNLKKTSRNKHRVSLGTVIWATFLAFNVIIIGTVLIFQVVLLDKFYKSSTKNDLAETAATIANVYTTNQQNREYIPYLDALHLSDDLACEVYISTIEYEKKYDNLTATNTNPYIFNAPTYFDSLGNQNSMVYYEDNYIIFVSKEFSNNLSCYIIITTPIENVGYTVNILKRQIIWIAIASILLSFILARFLSLRISEPIKNLSNSVIDLSKGKFNIEFPKSNYYETNQLSESLTYASHELGKAEQLQRDVLANVTHDFKTPLTLIKSYAEMIRDISGDDKEKRDAHLQTIIEETDRMNKLINDVLALSKAQADVESKNIEFSLSGLCNDSVVRFDELASTKKIHFTYSIQDHVHIIGNKEQIAEVLYNYISNAFNYTRTSIHVTLEVLDKVAIFKVTDDGMGISQEEIPNIFKRYYRSSDSHIRSVNGTGLGLSIVKAILDRHSFTYDVSSEVGVGSTFMFTAPIANSKK